MSHRIKKKLTTCIPNVNVAGFQKKKKRNIHHRYMDFDCLFMQGHSPVQVTLFHASDGSEIQT